MAQGVVLTLKAVAVKGIGITILTVKAIARRKIMVFARRPGEFNIAIAAGEALDARRPRRWRCWKTPDRPWRVFARLPRRPFIPSTPSISGPLVKNWPFWYHRGRGVPEWWYRRSASRSISGRFFGNDVDHAAERIGAVKGGHRAAHHLDTFDGIHRDPVQVEVIVAEDGVAGVDAFPVDEDQGIAAAQTANADALAVIPFVSELDPRDIAQYVFQVLDGLTL